MHIVPRRGRGRPRYPGVLTPAEQRVLLALRAGKPNAVIATELGVSVNTVRTQVSSVLGKLALRSRGELRAMEGLMAKNRPELRCSFCLKSESEVQYLLGGADDSYICGACVEACNQILAQQRAG